MILVEHLDEGGRCRGSRVDRNDNMQTMRQDSLQTDTKKPVVVGLKGKFNITTITRNSTI